MSRKSYPNVNAANQYARDVVRGKIVACQFVIQACQRHLDDLMAEKSKSFRYRFDKGLAAREAISLAAATEEHGARLFSNGAVTSGVLRTEQTLSDQAYERLKKDFEERHTGLGNAHRPMILEMGLDWKSMALNAEDSQFLETRKFQLEEICRLFRVPLHMVQNTDRATFNNIEELGLGFINYSLVPYLTRIEQRINTGLVRKSKQGVYYAKFNAGALLRGDMKSRFEAYATGINWGIYSPNDCRDLEDMNPRPGGDVYLTPMNMTTKPSDGSKAGKQKDNANADETTS